MQFKICSLGDRKVEDFSLWSKNPTSMRFHPPSCSEIKKRNCSDHLFQRSGCMCPFFTWKVRSPKMKDERKTTRKTTRRNVKTGSWPTFNECNQLSQYSKPRLDICMHCYYYTSHAQWNSYGLHTQTQEWPKTRSQNRKKKIQAIKITFVINLQCCGPSFVVGVTGTYLAA